MPKIFNKFYRVPNADPWKQGGTGLGLAISNKIIEDHQGEFNIESSKLGTKINIKFPVNTNLLK